MRNFIILTISLIALISFGVIQLNYLNSTSKYLIADARYIENLVNNDNFKEAKKHMEVLNSTWDNMNSIWCIFIHHNETEGLKEQMVNLEKSIELENKENTFISSSQIINKLENIVRKQNVLIENVF